MSNFEKVCMGVICLSASLFMIVASVGLALKVFGGC